MERDMYELEWKAKRGTWATLLYNMENRKSEREYREARYQTWVRYYGQAYADERRADEHEYEQRLLEHRLRAEARDKAIRPLLASLEPVNSWVGAAWVDTEGNLYPVRYCNHTSRAEELAPHHFAKEIERIREREGWVDCGEFLSHHKGWLRIGADGLVGDHRWQRVQDMKQAQLDAISSMLQRGQVRGTNDYRETGSFMGGLRFSVRYALGEINESGRTPEEQAEHERKYEHLRARWARHDARRAAEWEARYMAASSAGW
jgi:hypothetical protein